MLGSAPTQLFWPPSRMTARLRTTKQLSEVVFVFVTTRVCTSALDQKTSARWRMGSPSSYQKLGHNLESCMAPVLAVNLVTLCVIEPHGSVVTGLAAPKKTQVVLFRLMSWARRDSLKCPDGDHGQDMVNRNKLAGDSGAITSQHPQTC
ncbi:hypothetical protein LY76DRAFT_597610 [Colletotrichum caudatum]|nr:hypothetical protein LY76DRAFT_597610 [Colletotrichum caudatum]